MYLGSRHFTFRLGHEGFWAAYLRYMLVGVVTVLTAVILASSSREPASTRGSAWRSPSS
jgi:hypothetical protein